MLKLYITYLKLWWRKHIIDVCPPELEDIEFSEKFRNNNLKKKKDGN